ncbi:hypothetical protein [Nocardia asiatica]|uniref:hypothetical protein n=1 Tax=Nocardia asiatica TaxID=209252 RepID=UPI003EE1D6B2
MRAATGIPGRPGRRRDPRPGAAGAADRGGARRPPRPQRRTRRSDAVHRARAGSACERLAIQAGRAGTAAAGTLPAVGDAPRPRSSGRAGAVSVHPADRFSHRHHYRFVSGSFAEPGPAVCWIRIKHPIVAGTDPSPLERTLAAADSGNGVSAVLDWSKYLFINTDLTVTLHRQPVGEWVCLDAVTYPQPHGIGMAESALYDEKGPLGRSTQTLFLGTR